MSTVTACEAQARIYKLKIQPAATAPAAETPPTLLQNVLIKLRKYTHANEETINIGPNNCGAILFIVAKRRVMQFPLRSRLLTLSYTGLESGLGQREQSVPNADATASGKFVAVEKLRCRCHVQRSGFFCLHQHPFGRRGALWRCNQSLWSSR